MNRKALILSSFFVLGLLVLGNVGFAQGTGYGGNGDKVTICKATGSPYNPYVEVTVPEHVAEQFLDEGGVYPNEAGECPGGIAFSQVIKEKQLDIFNRLTTVVADLVHQFSKLIAMN